MQDPPNDSPLRLWASAGLVGFGLGALLSLIGQEWASLPGVVVLAIFFVTPSVLLVVLIVGVAGIFLSRRNRARSIAAVIFAAAYITSFVGTALLVTALDRGL